MMNGALENTIPKSKRSISPRPRTVGEEDKVFHDPSDRCSELYKNCTWNMDEKQESAACEREQQYRPTTPAEDSSFHANDPVENSSNPCPPPPYRWAQSLICLLEDIQGVNLFKQFLEQEGQDTKSLDFWFACRGVKRADPKDKEERRKLIKLIFEKKAIKISAISSAAKDQIKQKLSTNVGVDDTIFDTAQREVEAYMMKTTYPNFLRSDIYIQHLRGWQTEPLEKETVSASEPIDLLPTVHEDSELQISSSNQVLLTRENLLQRYKINSNSRGKLEGPAHQYIKSPYGNYSSYHCKYSSYLPASAQDSELQSLSSDAQTDDTMSLTDSSSIDINFDYSMKNKKEQKRQQKAAKQNARENKDIHTTFIPRTQRLPNSKLNDITSEEARVELLTKLNRVYAEQKIEEKLKHVNNDYSKQEQNPVPNPGACQKTNAPPVFDDAFFCNTSDDNVQDILDQHVSRVWNDSGQHTPACSSPGCMSPPIARPLNEPKDRSRVPQHGSNYYEPTTQDPILAYGPFHKVNQNSQFTVPQSLRSRKDQDMHSKDSCITNDYHSDNSLSMCHRGPTSIGSSASLESYQIKRVKEQMKRSAMNRKSSAMTDSNSSFFDSGISMTCKSVVPPSNKVAQWLERGNNDLEKEQSWRNSSTSPVLNRSSRKAVAYNSSRSGTLESGSTPWPMVNSQEMYVPSCPPPEITFQLLEARRRLEDETRNKMKPRSTSNSRNYHDPSKTKFSKPSDLPDDGYTLRKQSRKSYPADGGGVNTSWNDVTVIGYSYGRCAVPYLSKMPGKNITLRQFKSLLSKKGNFRYFFKKASNDFGTGVVFEEITDDFEVLPLWEGKVFCCIESIDDNSS